MIVEGKRPGCGRGGFDTARMKEASPVWHKTAMRFESTVME
jgi:hypothetical protein